jgi:hypothetical protein
MACCGKSQHCGKPLNISPGFGDIPPAPEAKADALSASFASLQEPNSLLKNGSCRDAESAAADEAFAFVQNAKKNADSSPRQIASRFGMTSTGTIFNKLLKQNAESY